MCDCVNIEIGSYGNQLCVVDLPEHMSKYKAKQGGASSICLDKCIADEVKELWALGITTTGCCCGHNKILGYIGVIDQDIERMEGLGYSVACNPCRPESRDSFIPKSLP